MPIPFTNVKDMLGVLQTCRNGEKGRKGPGMLKMRCARLLSLWLCRWNGAQHFAQPQKQQCLLAGDSLKAEQKRNAEVGPAQAALVGHPSLRLVYTSEEKWGIRPHPPYR
jgi:hypothetical protein